MENNNVSWKEYVDQRFDELEKSLTRRFGDQDKAVLASGNASFHELDELRNDIDRRFAVQEKNVETAFAASKEAIIKSETGVEKRSDAIYVTITKLQDSLISVMPRAEAEQRFRALSEKIDSLKTTSDTTTGKASGFDKSWAIALGALGGIATIIGVILAFNN